MIGANDFYKVMSAMIPLYFAMLIGYSSVKWWKIFSPEQCSGINRFVSLFAVPVLSFHFIYENNPYHMDLKFIMADSLSKFFVLFLFSIWAICQNQLDWLITLFSVSTLPNTLVIGIPLLKAMYGEFTQNLMVQLVVLQCIIWYTLLLFLFEYRAATILILDQFPGSCAGNITKFVIDDDVVSLDNRNPLCTESELDANGSLRVRIRQSTSSVPGSATYTPSTVRTPRESNLTNGEIFSVNTPVVQEFQNANGDYMGFEFASPSPGGMSGYASSDAYSLHPTPRRISNSSEMDTATTTATTAATNYTVPPVCVRLSPATKLTRESPGKLQGNSGGTGNGVAEEGEGGEISFRNCLKITKGEKGERSENQRMPKSSVMLRLILTMVARKLSRNPNTYSSILGLLWSLISFKWNIEMPILVKDSVNIISDAGLGMAMFSLGLFMAQQTRTIACGTRMAVMSMVIRFACGPILMSVASVAVGLHGNRLHTAIVQAALPQGIVPFVFAREYKLHADILSTGVIFGMLVSLPVTLVYYIILGLL